MINLNPNLSNVQPKQPIRSNSSKLSKALSKDIANFPHFGDKPEKGLFTRIADKIKGWWHSLLIFMHLRSKADEENNQAENQANGKSLPRAVNVNTVPQQIITDKQSVEDLELSLNEKETQHKTWINKLTLLNTEFQKQLLPIYMGIELPKENKQAIKKIAPQISELGKQLFENFTEQEKLIETLEIEHQKNYTSKKHKLSFDKEKYNDYNAPPEKVEENLLHVAEKLPEFMAKYYSSIAVFSSLEDETELLAKQEKLGESLAAILKK